ncbi:hypothetical protein KFL_002550180 [Klebsormidium nitens]|uniref:Cytochrome b5 heme-binding domain-containing protein n=1 Tax=Klebsormidium nitens TaxID=105231 RepID=A0A1Y1I9L4_KLENI|nr:hypothetical protein KFL_002550180 [Klebsormidium nitens]|eukprot:GAQ85811.1 hypothetical protein KFL_002550180 [Klebsormidium nitens]
MAKQEAKVRKRAVVETAAPVSDASTEGPVPVGEPHPSQESRLAQYYGIVVVALVVFAILFYLGKRNEVQRLWFPEELSEYTGADDKPILIAILGTVFDVTKGADHYGPGGGYSHFAGRDASAAFVTGDFSPAGLTDDVSGLAPSQVAGVAQWRQFYVERYKQVGVLAGRYYDDRGEATAALRSVEAALEEAAHEDARRKEEEKQYPACNSRWSQAAGGEVWCDKGFPRQFFSGSEHLGTRCACVQAQDLDRPDLRQYASCEKYDNRCKTS